MAVKSLLRKAILVSFCAELILTLHTAKSLSTIPMGLAEITREMMAWGSMMTKLGRMDMNGCRFTSLRRLRSIKSISRSCSRMRGRWVRAKLVSTA